MTLFFPDALGTSKRCTWHFQVPRRLKQRPRFAPWWSSRTAWPCSSRRHLASAFGSGYTQRKVRQLFGAANVDHTLSPQSEIIQFFRWWLIQLIIFAYFAFLVSAVADELNHPMIGWALARSVPILAAVAVAVHRWGTGPWNISVLISHNIFAS